jgi:DNA-binding response OmpR family regulator
LTLPGGNGLDLIQKLKELSVNTGIIIISAKNSISDKINGLNLGADDYLTKPFHLAELNARIKSVLRRRQNDGDNKIIFEEIMIIPDKREVYINKSELILTRKEYDLLFFLISNKSRVITKESIAEHIWGDNADSFDNLDFVYSQIKNLRKKMTEAGCNDYIKSIYGIGYKITPQ